MLLSCLFCIITRKAVELVSSTKKTHTCGDLTKKDVGATVTLMGWVHTRRDHGGIMLFVIG